MKGLDRCMITKYTCFICSQSNKNLLIQRSFRSMLHVKTLLPSLWEGKSPQWDGNFFTLIQILYLPPSDASAKYSIGPTTVAVVEFVSVKQDRHCSQIYLACQVDWILVQNTYPTLIRNNTRFRMENFFCIKSRYNFRCIFKIVKTNY